MHLFICLDCRISYALNYFSSCPRCGQVNRYDERLREDRNGNLIALAPEPTEEPERSA